MQMIADGERRAVSAVARCDDCDPAKERRNETMSKTEKLKRDNQQDSKAKTRRPSVPHRRTIVTAIRAKRPYYVPHLEEYRSIEDLTHEDRESIADRLFGPLESKARDDLIRQMKKLAGEKKESK